LGDRSVAAERPRELLEIERVTAALVVEHGYVGRVDLFTQKLASLDGRQSGELDAGQCCLTMRPLKGNRQTRRHLPGAHRDCHEHGCGRRPAQQGAEQLDGRRVGPVEVVEQEDERPGVGKLLEQRAHGTVAAVALVLECNPARGRECRQRREDVGELGADVFVQTGQAIRIESLQVLVERIHEDREGQISLELRRGAREEESPTRIRASRELCQQARFPDPGLPDELDRGRTTLIDLGEDLIEPAELLGAPHEVSG
jgi:hypothetical protein